jgi:hypothetical protein
MKSNSIFFFLLLFCGFKVSAQERVQVLGKVRSGAIPLENVHIQNISSENATISDASGYFQLKIKIGDTLLLTHVSMHDHISYVKEDDLKNLVLNMLQKPTELKEVVVNDHSEINAVALGIIPKDIENLSTNERRLKTAGDFKPIHLLSILGGSLPIDPILNAINGRTKRLKRNIDIEKRQKNIAFLEINYLNYMKEEMQLTDAQAQLLINFIIEDAELTYLVDLNNEARLQFFLQDAWYRLKEEN